MVGTARASVPTSESRMRRRRRARARARRGACMRLTPAPLRVPSARTGSGGTYGHRLQLVIEIIPLATPPRLPVRRVACTRAYRRLAPIAHTKKKPRPLPRGRGETNEKFAYPCHRTSRAGEVAPRRPGPPWPSSLRPARGPRAEEERERRAISSGRNLDAAADLLADGRPQVDLDRGGLDADVTFIWWEVTDGQAPHPSAAGAT